MPDPPRQTVAYRPMTAGDVPVATYIRKTALEWLSRGEGREPTVWVPRIAAHLAHIIDTDRGGSWVAEIEGIVVGFSQAIVRGDIWFLAQLFVQPEAHSHGVGRELLDRARAYGAARGARVYSVVSSTSPVAQSLYMRAGMFGIGIGYNVSGPVAPLLALPAPDLAREAIVDCRDWQDRIAALDGEVFGAERREDHAHLLSTEAPGPWRQASFALVRDGDLAGYAYADDLDANGWISPMAAFDPADQLPLMRTCADWLHGRGVESGAMWVLSSNTTVLGALLAAGWRVNRWLFFLATERFGKFDRYHPFNGVLL